MPCLPRAVVIFLSAAIGFLAFSCTESKNAQCEGIIQTANQFATKATQLTNGGQTDDPQAILQAADAMDQAAEKMQAISLTDPQLQNYRASFVKMYQEISKATRDYVKAYNNKDRPGAEDALSKLQRATQPEQELVQGINQYCLGK
jgi:hypothetical protein